MPEAGYRSRFPRIQYHAGGRDATAFRGESGPGTGFRGGFRGEFRFGGQDCPFGDAEGAAARVANVAKYRRTRRRVPHQTSQSTAVRIEFKAKCQGTLKTRYFSVYLAYVREKRCCEVFTAYMRETLLGSPLWSFREAPNGFHAPPS